MPRSRASLDRAAPWMRPLTLAEAACTNAVMSQNFNLTSCMRRIIRAILAVHHRPACVDRCMLAPITVWVASTALVTTTTKAPTKQMTLHSIRSSNGTPYNAPWSKRTKTSLCLNCSIDQSRIQYFRITTRLEGHHMIETRWAWWVSQSFCHKLIRSIACCRPKVTRGRSECRRHLCRRS